MTTRAEMPTRSATALGHWNDGCSPAWIAERMGVSERMVYRYLRTAGATTKLPPRTELADRIEAARKYRERGMTVEQIADQLGVTTRSVDRYLAAANVSTPRRTFTDEQWDFARRLLEDGCPYAEVVRTTGISRWALKRRFPGYGARDAGVWRRHVDRKAGLA